MTFGMNTFLGNGKNKEMLFNLIECSIKEDRHRLKERVVFFSNREYYSKIRSEGSCLVPEKASDHEEADTKLVALVNSAGVNAGESFMVRSPSGDIGILVLFLLHQFEGKTVYIDNGTGKHKTGKNNSLKHYLECMLFREMITYQAFFEKGNC